ncbi:MAG: adenylate kinase [Tannerellaceae bacterium]|jgi:adenylate kinase|nr:adenylate kinase [Tannerellaceae bacterium]
MLNVVIFGAPGSGKGTQSELIMKEFELDHISTGEVLRNEIREGTELGKIADEYISKGQLLPDELIIDILGKELDGKKDSKGVVFDGFPRTIPQAKALKKMLNERGTDVAVMLDLHVEEDELVRRILERGKLSGRQDDNLETIKSRLEVYHNQTAPLAGYYREEGTYHAIRGGGTIEDIFGLIKKKLDSLVTDSQDTQAHG